jgi:hypothetical protein
MVKVFEIVEQRQEPRGYDRVARHSMSEDRAPSRGVFLLPKRILRCRLEGGLKRLYYKAFAEAKPPALSQRW